MQCLYPTCSHTSNIQDINLHFTSFAGQIKVLQSYVNPQTVSPPERFSAMQAHLWKLVAMFFSETHPGIILN